MTEENSNKPNKYKNGKIYAIRNYIDDDVYIGSTIQPLSKRFNDHKTAHIEQRCLTYPFYTKMSNVGVDKFYIELVENYPCENKEELRKREGELIREKGTLNKQIAGRTQLEWEKENLELVKQYKKRYTQSHKEQLKYKREDKKENKATYDKEYRIRNRQKIIDNESTKVECVCGSIISKSNLSTHKKYSCKKK